MTAAPEVRAAGVEAAALLAALRRAAGVAPDWRTEDFAALLIQPSVHALVAATDDLPLGYVLFAATADEAEIYDIAVARDHRRCGIGAALLDAAIAAVRRGGATRLHLEVAVDNPAALALYTGRGFTETGRRRGYYGRGRGAAADALVMTLLI